MTGASPGAGTGAAARAEPAADVAIVELYRAHRLGLVRLAILFVDDRETAEDVVQDAFAALHRQWPRLAGEQAALPYLRTCVVNGARSVLRRRRTVRARWRPDDPGTEAPADASALLADEHAQVLRALAHLPQRQREVIVLRYWSQLSEREVAATLGISLGAVKSTASRGRDTLAHLLADGGRP